MIEQTVKCDRCRRKIEGAFVVAEIHDANRNGHRVDETLRGASDLCLGCWEKLRKFLKWPEAPVMGPEDLPT